MTGSRAGAEHSTSSQRPEWVHTATHLAEGHRPNHLHTASSLDVQQLRLLHATAARSCCSTGCRYGWP